MANWGTIDAGELLTAIHKVSPDIIYLFDIETESILYISDNITTVLGYAPQAHEELKAQFLQKISTPENAAQANALRTKREHIKNGEVIYLKIYCFNKNGENRCFQSREVLFPTHKEDNQKVLLGILQDVTEWEKDRQELSEMAAIAQKTTNAVLIVTLDETIEWANEGYEKLTGYSLNELLGKKPNVLARDLPQNLATTQAMRAKMAKGEAFSGELVSYKKTEEEFWVRITANPIIDEQGHIAKYIFIAQNITELKQNEARLIQSYEKLKKYAFFTSHQLRSPIADILSILDVYDYDNPLNADNISLLHDLKSISQKLDTVIHQLNDIVSFEKVQFAHAQNERKHLKNIMLVDDDKVFINITGLIFRSFNKTLDIKSYTNPQLALQKLEEKENLPDAVFLDINMPDVDGWMFLDNLQKQDINIDVYMLTSSIDPYDIQKSKNYANVKGYLTKPLTKQVLVDFFSL